MAHDHMLSSYNIHMHSFHADNNEQNALQHFLTIISSLVPTQLSQELGFPIRPKKELTFQKCVEMNLQAHIDKIAKIAELAGKEYSIEQVCTNLVKTVYYYNYPSSC